MGDIFTVLGTFRMKIQVHTNCCNISGRYRGRRRGMVIEYTNKEMGNEHGRKVGMKIHDE
jgi:hypothetical protein